MGLDQQPVEMQKGRGEVQIPKVILNTQHIPAEVFQTRLDRLNLWEAKLTIQKWTTSRIKGTFNFTTSSQGTFIRLWMYFYKPLQRALVRSCLCPWC